VLEMVVRGTVAVFGIVVGLVAVVTVMVEVIGKDMVHFVVVAVVFLSGGSTGHY